MCVQIVLLGKCFRNHIATNFASFKVPRAMSIMQINICRRDSPITKKRKKNMTRKNYDQSS